MTHFVPVGFRMAGVAAGLKSDPAKKDLTLIASNTDVVAAGVYTKNVVHSAAVSLNRQKTPGKQFRAVVVNSGNANACTGKRGERDANRIIELAAAACGAGRRRSSASPP